VFELHGNIDRSDGLAGADRASGGRQAFAALTDAQPWGRRDVLDDPGRNSGTVHVDDYDIEPAHDRAAERPGENRKCDQRDRNQQKQAGTIAPKKPDLACRNQPQTRACWRSHGDRFVQSA